MQLPTGFFYSNLFIALVTFVVGTFVLILYQRRKNDEKRRAASIILLEVENAQDRLKECQTYIAANEGELPEHLYAMPTDSWTPNKHLFVKDFKPAEWNALNRFYDTCQLYDEAISHNDSRFAEHEKEISHNVHRATYHLAMKYCDEIEADSTDDQRAAIVKKYFDKRNNAVEMLTDGAFLHIYTPKKHYDIVRTCLSTVDTNISHSKVGQRLDYHSKHRTFKVL